MILTEVKLYSRLNVRSAGGYTVYEEDDLHKPLFTRSAVRDADTGCFARNEDVLYSFDRVTPRKGRELDTMELPIPWDEFQGAVGLLSTPKLVTAKFSGLNMADAYVFVYGWIEDAEPVSVKGPESNTRIHWHPDWWLIYSDFAWFTMQSVQHAAAWSPRRVSFGEGHLLSGPETYARPDTSEPRKWELESSTPLKTSFGTGEQWAIIAYTYNEQINNIRFTQIDYLFWQVGAPIVAGSNTYASPDYAEIFEGDLEELLGLDPQSITGCWLSPIQPRSTSQTPKVGRTVGETTYAAYRSGVFNKIAFETRIWVDNNDHSVMLKTDDYRKVVFIDTGGAPIYTAPWGITFSSVRMCVDMGTSGCSIQCYLDNGDGNKAEEGRLFSFPLPSLPITENAWQSYNYSGQRDYDVRMREISRNQAAVNGISGIGTSAIGGAIAGSAVAPGPGTMIGAVAGIVAGSVGTIANYASSGYFDVKAQSATDKLVSNQASALIVTAYGMQGLFPMGKDEGMRMVVMKRDDVSMAELVSEHTELGWSTSVYSADCSSLISAGGPLRIEGLRVKGDMSNDGKRYISEMFARGVHLDLIEGA